MKKWFRTLLCGAVLTLSLTVPTFAAENDLLIAPAAPQGDFTVLVNGEYVAFTDAVPKIKNDRSCLPFVAVFEQLGFAEEDMTWNGDTKTVTATKGDTTISLTIGKNEIILTQGGETQVIATDVAPYIEPALSRTYIPFGLVADALAYNVGWDANTRTVIIDDVDAILAANPETYALMDKYLDYSQSFAQKNQKVDGAYTMYMGMEDPSTFMEILVNGEYDMLMAGSTAMQFETDMVLDMGMTVDGQDAMVEAGDTLPMTIDMDLRGDLNDGTLYFQSAALTEMMGQPDMTNAWYKLDLRGLFDGLSAVTGMDYASLMTMSANAAEMDFAEYLTATLKAMPLTDVNMTTSTYLEMVNLFCADSAFEKSGSKYVNELSLGEIDEYGTEASMCFTLYTNGSKVNGYSITMSVGDSSGMLMEMNVSMENKEMTAEIAISSVTEESEMLLSMSMGGTYQATSTAPATEPPAGAVVIDLMELLEQSMTPEAEA